MKKYEEFRSFPTFNVASHQCSAVYAAHSSFSMHFSMVFDRDLGTVLYAIMGPCAPNVTEFSYAHLGTVHGVDVGGCVCTHTALSP